MKDKMNFDAPQGLNKGFQSAGYNWCFMMLEKGFYTSAIQGMILSIVFTFFVLLLTSFNIIIALCSVFSIGAVLSSILAII